MADNTLPPFPFHEPLLTEDEARTRAAELVALFDKNPDILSPDEQALVMMLKFWMKQYTGT